MKSEKAKRLLNNGRFHVFCLKGEYPEQRFSPEGKYIEYAQGASAVKLAEQEAEERMRAKAIKAYCQSCHGTAVGECLIGTKNCGALRDFIQNLNRG